MLSFSILEQEYSVKNKLSELTLAEFILLAKSEQGAPQKLKDIWAAPTEFVRAECIKQITDVDYYKDFVPFFIDWLSVLSGIEKEVWATCPSNELENLYTILHKSFDIPEKSADVEQIEHEGKTWYLPNELMKNSTVGEYVTAAHIQDLAQKKEGSHVFSLAKLCAILLREKKDAAFTDANLLNEDIFKSMTMDKVWLVCFFLTKRVQLLGVALQIYSAMEAGALV